MSADRTEVLETVVLSRCSCRETDAEKQCLLQDEDQHARQDSISIASCRVEDRLCINRQGLGVQLFVAFRKRERAWLLSLSSHLERYGLCRLVDGLVGQHQTHVAVDTHVCLFATVQCPVEIFREIENSMHDLLACQVLCFLQVVAIAGSMYIRRGIEITDEFTGRSGVGEVDDCDRHLADNLIVVYP